MTVRYNDNTNDVQVCPTFTWLFRRLDVRRLCLLEFEARTYLATLLLTTSSSDLRAVTTAHPVRPFAVPCRHRFFSDS